MSRQWECTVCGEMYAGENSPKTCPVCGADVNSFKMVNEAEEFKTAADT